MILSVSRRTDIPAYYSKWFLNRIKEGYVLVPNPMNIHQISKISLSPKVIDCIVFWSKNPAPLLPYLDALKEYKYYFQFTLNSYDRDIEMYLPNQSELICTFKTLSEKIGANKVIWRYDPIFVSSKYSIEKHLEGFENIAKQLERYTDQCIVSFVDIYSKIQSKMAKAEIKELSLFQVRELSEELVRISKKYGFRLETCAEKVDLTDLGIKHAHCIDSNKISELIGKPISVSKDKNQREECGCAASIDIGMYNTCKNGCLYCYANFNDGLTKRNYANHNPESPMLIGEIKPEDIVKEREVKSLVTNNTQLSFF